jgi:hypothetical protein
MFFGATPFCERIAPLDFWGLRQMTFFQYIGPAASLAVGLISTSAWMALLGYELIKLL